MLGLPTWEGGMFICKSISGAHDDMTYFTFYKQSPERNVLQCIAMYCIRGESLTPCGEVELPGP